MLDVTPQNLLLEIDSAVRLRDHHVTRAREIIRGYVGYDFDAGRDYGSPSPENHAFEYMTLMLGRLVADNPAIAVRAPFAQFEWVADALEDAANQWIVRNNIQSIIEGIVAEALICYGVGMVSFEVDPAAPVTANGTRRMRPVFAHIPFWRYFRDYRGCNGIPQRFEGHVWVRDKADLENDERYDPAMVEKLMVDAGLSDAGERDSSPTRKEVVGYEVWVPDAKLPPGLDPQKYHGMVYTLGTTALGGADPNDGRIRDGKRVSGYLREPQPFYGPASGPYKLFGGWPVPGSPYRLAPLMATKEQAEEHNAHMNAITHSALQRKTVIITNSANTGLKNTLKNSRDGYVYGVKGYQSGQFDQIEIGGPTKEQLDYADRVKQRLDNNLGMSDAQRGNPKVGVTATADQISANSSNIRTDSYQTSIKNATADVMRNVCWYMFQSEFFVTRLSAEFAKKYQLQDPRFSGGDHPMTEDLTADDLLSSLNIQPYSMERVDPVTMQGRMQQLVPLAISIAQAQAQMPYADFNSLWDQLARAHNFDWLNSFIDEQKLAQWSQQQAQMAMQQQQAEMAAKKKPLVGYSEAPADIKGQMEAKDGYQPSQLWLNYPLFDPNQPSGSGNPAGNIVVGTPATQALVEKFRQQEQAQKKAEQNAKAKQMGRRQMAGAR